MKYALFLGCIAKNVYPGLESSIRLVAEQLGIQLVDYRFSCCPPPGVVRSYDHQAWMGIAARNLALAEQDGLDILTVCNGCYGTLHRVHSMLNQNRELLDQINVYLQKLGLEYKCRSKPIHCLDLILENSKKIKQLISREMNLRLAVHYGCHYLKPRDGRSHAEIESPRLIEDVLEDLGAQAVDYPHKMMCCGAGGGVWSGFPDISLKILDLKLQGIKQAEPDAILNICSFCHMHFDQGQSKLRKTRIPVIHLVQLIGLGMGIRDRALGLHTHLISTRDLVKKCR